MADLSGRKPILCLDFDGVIHSYTSGWKGADVIPDPPVDGAFAFIAESMKYFEVDIFSSRSNQKGGIGAMEDWFVKHCPSHLIHIIEDLKFPLEKPPAFVGIDDRVITFTGKFPSAESLRSFKPWNAKSV